MKKIFEYTDFRCFLKEYYLEKKRTTGFFTYRYFAAIAGFASPVFLKLVMDKKSNLSEKSISCLSAAMQLNAAESNYFETLVRFNQSKSFEKKKILFENLRSQCHDYSVKVLDSDQYDFYQKWFNAALRELLPNYKGGRDAKTIGSLLCPPVSPREIKKAIALLKTIGLLSENEDGSFSQTSKLISTGSEIESMAVRDLHLQMSKLATASLEKVPKEARDISGLTLGVSSVSFESIKKELEAFRSRIMALVAQDRNVDQVYRLNLQLFPLSKKWGKPGEMK
jgi:uncharacterized protein (TIGR02147 family)